MKHDEFVGQVQNRARLASNGDAERAIQATLSTLGERLAGNEAEHIASELPPVLGSFLRSSTSGSGERLSLQDFYTRVCEREGVDRPDAVYHSKVVMEVLGEAISEGEMEHVRLQLPREYDDLFEGSRG